MPRVFISYRRDDSAGHAGRLFDRLSDHFGPGQVFMDVEGIQPGVDYIEAVQEAVQSCDVLIAVIGKEWLEASDVTGGRRLDDAADLVGIEIATALDRNIRVIPVLVRGAREPPSTDLPDALKPLARRNALELSDTRFSSDVRRLVDAIQTPAPDHSIGSGFVGHQAPRPDRPTGGPFVGRQREMGELQTALEDTLSGHGKMVMLVGEPGIGKTRLAQELTTRAAGRGAEVLSGRCYEGEGAPPYWPWVQLIRTYLQLKDPNQLQSEMGPGAAVIAEIVSEVREKLPDLEPPPALEPEQARFRLFDSITTFLKNASQERPIMLLLDDLHWADRPSLQLLQFLSREMRESRLLVIGTYRDAELSRQHPLSDTLAQLTREPVFRRQLLRGLSQEDTRAIIQAAAEIDLSNRLLEGIYAHTEGNPFFIAEVIWLLAERGELTADSIGGPQGISIPEGVRQLIGQRLNRLSEQCVQTLTTASVVGREFSFRLLGHLTNDLNEDQLLRVIDEALEVHLIEELPGSGERYEFSHALIQQTLSDELSASRKVRLHARIGEALEELYTGGVEDHAAELAYHFAEAVPYADTEKLVRYSLLAGEQALAAYAWEVAATHFERGLNSRAGQPMDAQMADLHFGLARAQTNTLARHRLHEVWDTINLAFDYYISANEISRALTIAEYPFTRLPGSAGTTRLLAEALKLAPPDSHQAGRLMARYAAALSSEFGDYEGVIKTLGQALAIAQRESDAALEMNVLTTMANTQFWYLRYQESLENSLRAIELGRTLSQLPGGEFNADWYAERALIPLGNVEGAWAHAASYLANAERYRDRFHLARALDAHGVLALLEGKWEAARHFSDRGLAVDERDARLLYHRAILEYEVGDYSQGDAYLEHLVDTMRDSPRNCTPYQLVPMAVGLAAQITGAKSHFDAAEEAAQALLSLPSLLPFYAQLANTGLALLAVVRGDAAVAGDQYAALERWPVTMTSHNLACGHRVLGLLARTMDKLDQAVAHFEESLAFCRRAGYRPELAWSCHDYAECLLQRNHSTDRERARALLRESGDIANELGMRPLAGRVTALPERA